MNVLKNKEEMIDKVARDYDAIAKKIKVAMVDAFFEDRVSIENVDAAFKIASDATDIETEIYKLEASIKISSYSEDSIEDIFMLKKIVDSVKEKTIALERVLEDLSL